MQEVREYALSHSCPGLAGDKDIVGKEAEEEGDVGLFSY
jgi:hypothetical protein